MSFGWSVGDIIKGCELAARVYKNCRDCPGDYKSLTTETRSLTNLLEDIQDKYDKIPESKRRQLIDAYEPCIDVLKELDVLLIHYNSLDTKAARAWNRLNHDPDKLRRLRERLVASVAMLNTFYTSLVHDSQVVILEALERLERDYQGGHREESIASIGMITSDVTEDDDAAWTQILRDLDDVGISQSEAIRYRDMIVDWLVQAVNEGRFQEQAPTQDVESSEELSSEIASINTPQLNNHSVCLPLTDSNSGLAPSRQVALHNPFMRSPQELSSQADSQSMGSQISDSDTTSLRYPIPDAAVPLQLPGIPSRPPLPTPGVSPSGFHEGINPMSGDLDWIAQLTVTAWEQCDFDQAEKLLEKQLEAVESGLNALSGKQPDRRVLRHLIGVCASFRGQFEKAKQFFESVFNGIYLGRESLDEGDIAAARWLGDVCLHLREHHNALLAYSVAFEGLLGRFGISQERTRRAACEIRALDHWLFAFGRIESAFQQTDDPTDVFASRHAAEKSNLIRAVKARIYEMKDLNFPGPPTDQFVRPTYIIGPRPHIETKVSKTFLLAPLVSVSSWPLPWDPTFSPQGAAQLYRYMNTIQTVSKIIPLKERPLPSNPLGQSKALWYVTKRGSDWLIEAVKKGLREKGIEYTEHGYEASIVCCLRQRRNGFAFFEGVVIKFRKLQFRSNVHGIRVSNAEWASRTLAPVRAFSGQARSAAMQGDSTDFRNMIKDMLETAEARAD